MARRLSPVRTSRSSQTSSPIARAEPRPTSCRGVLRGDSTRQVLGEQHMALHCPECGFVNDEGANYCQRCGALLPRGDGGSGEPVTATYRIDETGELVPVELDEVTAHGSALVVRAGGGRVGEGFPIGGERLSIG